MPEAQAFIFKDDDWSDFCHGSSFGLDDIYGIVQKSESKDETAKPNYISKLTTDHFEYVYQWIHAVPTSLLIEHIGSYEALKTTEIGSYNFRALFYNLFNCSATRFTENNLGMTYLTKTDYCLASIGSTKEGGIFY